MAAHNRVKWSVYKVGSHIVIEILFSASLIINDGRVYYNLLDSTSRKRTRRWRKIDNSQDIIGRWKPKLGM